MNLIAQGILPGLILMFFKLDSNLYFGLFSGLLYSSYHNINQFILKSETHRKHHLNSKFNYGPDYIDVIFGTKYPGDEYENLNTGVINIIIIVIVIKYIKSFIRKK